MTILVSPGVTHSVTLQCNGKGYACACEDGTQHDNSLPRFVTYYNPFLVYCRELAPGTVSLTGDRAQGDDSKHDSHYTIVPTKSDSHVIFCLQLLGI